MKKFSWFKCLTLLFISLALIVGGVVLNYLKTTLVTAPAVVIENHDTARDVDIAVMIMLGLGAVLLAVDIIIILIKTTRIKVTEFALHFMRYAVIILAVSVSAFIILEHDYGIQSENAQKNALSQTAIAASVGISDVVGAETSSDEAYVISVTDVVEALLTQEQIDEGRSAALYLYIDLSDIYAEATGDFGTDLSVGLPMFACGNPPAGEDSVERAVYTIENEVRQINYFDYEDNEYLISTVPVYTTTGKCVGALEINENLNVKSALDLVNFPLIMTIGGAVILLIILYYALAHLLEVILRPRMGENENGLGANPAFRMGNESARSISLLMSMCCTIPLCPIFLDFSDESVVFFAEKASFIPEILLPYMPLLIYMLTCIIGNRLGGIMKNSLNIFFVAIGSAFAIAGAVMMLKGQPIYGVALWGLGYGFASRMVDKYRVYARYSEHGDSAVIYSPYLGLAAGILLGSFMYVRGGSRFLLICSAVIVGIVALLVCALFKNTSCAHISRDGDEDFLNEVYTRNAGFGRFGILAVVFSAVLSFGWFGLSIYLHAQGVTVTAITIGFACVILGGGVLGNLYRKAETPMLRFMFGISGLFLAASVVPFAIAPSQTTATVCYFLLVIAEVLGHGTINAYLTQDNRKAGDDGVYGTADDVKSFNTKDRIGYWGQGNLLLEITSLAAVVGGVYLISMDSMTIPLLMAAVIAAIIAVLNLILIVTSKPAESTALAVVEDKKEEKKEKAVPVAAPVPEKKEKKVKEEKPKKEKPQKEKAKKEESKPEEKEKDEEEPDNRPFILLDDLYEEKPKEEEQPKKEEQPSEEAPASDIPEESVSEPAPVPAEDTPSETPQDISSQYGNGDYDDTPYPPLIGENLKNDDVIAL